MFLGINEKTHIVTRVVERVTRVFVRPTDGTDALVVLNNASIPEIVLVFLTFV